MKRMSWAYVAIALLFVVMVLLQLRVPQRFSWNPTFSHRSDQPFGSMLFDSVLRQSLPEGYTVSRTTFYQLSKEPGIERKAILYCQSERMPSKLEVESMLSIVKRGATVLLTCGSSYNDTLLVHHVGMDIDSSSFSLSDVLDNKLKVGNLRYDTICWKADSAAGAPPTFYHCVEQVVGPQVDISKPVHVLAEMRARTYYVYEEHTCVDTVEVDDTAETDETEVEPVAKEKTYVIPIAAEARYGRGKIVMVSTPFLFTNYGMLEGDTSGFIFHLLSRLGRRPVVRVEPAGAGDDVEASRQSPLRYVLMQRPLKWAVYLTLFGILLFMLTTARRRQRAIPVVKEPGNPMLEFVRLVGTLFYRRKDNADLLRRAIDLFAAEVRSKAYVDILDSNEAVHAAQVLSTADNGNDSTAEFLERLRQFRKESYDINDTELKQVLNRMNHIKQQL